MGGHDDDRRRPSSSSSSSGVSLAHRARRRRVNVGDVRVVEARRRRRARRCPAMHVGGRRVAGVADVRLEGHAEDADLGALERPAAVVERLGDEVDDVARHREVDVAGELDEAVDEVELAGAPGRGSTDRPGCSGRRRPGPGVNFMNPNGFVAAALMTSQTSRPIRSHSSASWLTNAMLTLRKTFSRSFASSAASGEDSSTTWSLMLRRSAAARVVACGRRRRRRGAGRPCWRSPDRRG